MLKYRLQITHRKRYDWHSVPDCSFNTHTSRGCITKNTTNVTFHTETIHCNHVNLSIPLSRSSILLSLSLTQTSSQQENNTWFMYGNHGNRIFKTAPVVILQCCPPGVAQRYKWNLYNMHYCTMKLVHWKIVLYFVLRWRGGEWPEIIQCHTKYKPIIVPKNRYLTTKHINRHNKLPFANCQYK